MCDFLLIHSAGPSDQRGAREGKGSIIMGLWKKIRRIQKRLNDNRGQSTIEYILILFIVVMIAMKFKSIIGQQGIGMAKGIGDKIQEVERDDGG